MSDNIFSGMEILGFNDVKDLKIYKNKEVTILKEKVMENQRKEELTHIYDKEVTCPVCESVFKARTVKTASYKMIKKDSDFFIRYDLINPYFYDVWICNNCGYGAVKQDFLKIKSYEIKLVNEKIRPRWNSKQYGNVYNIDIAIERYKLALLNYVLIESKSSKKAMTCLKIAWMYRVKEDSENELVFLKEALEGFTNAYSTEDTPFYGIDNFTLMYLLGELNRKLGNIDSALSWFSKVITSNGASQKIKELARDQKDLIKEITLEPAIEASEEEEEEAPVNNNKGFFAKLFGR